MNDKVRGLVEKWRTEAKGAVDTLYEHGRVDEKLRCAEELEQALAAPAEWAEVVSPTELFLDIAEKLTFKYFERPDDPNCEPVELIAPMTIGDNSGVTVYMQRKDYSEDRAATQEVG
jgi:hypothetical protein